jgi:hypothetical protein
MGHRNNASFANPSSTAQAGGLGAIGMTLGDIRSVKVCNSGP